MSSHPFRHSIFVTLILSYTFISNGFAAQENVKVSEAWVRASAPGQDVGAAYLTLLSNTNTTLTKVESPVAGSIEIHSMTMDNGVMKMRMLDSLPLGAGKPVKLEPGSFHLMLFDLKQPLTTGQKASFTLTFKNKAGKPYTQKIELPVKAGAD